MWKKSWNPAKNSKIQTNSLHSVQLCYTSWPIQTKNLCDVTQCHNPSDWLLKTIRFEVLYRGLFTPNKTHDKETQNPSGVARKAPRWCNCPMLQEIKCLGDIMMIRWL